MRGFIITILGFLFSMQLVQSQVYEKFELKNATVNDEKNIANISFGKTNYLIYTLPKQDASIHDTDFYHALSDEQGGVEKGKLLNNGINSYINEVNLVYTNDMKKVYFTRSYVSEDRFVHYDIYSASIVKGKITHIKSLPINYNNFSTAFPTLSKDNKTLYFASDRRESLGGFDIFSVPLLKGGKKFGKVVHLGKEVNSGADETTPFIMGERLFFASDGRGGSGGFDLFSYDTELKVDAINLGETINSPKNDLGLIRKIHRDTGFFISNRDGGKGENDIYFFKATKIAPPPTANIATEITESVSETSNFDNEMYDDDDSSSVSLEIDSEEEDIIVVLDDDNVTPTDDEMDVLDSDFSLDEIITLDEEPKSDNKVEDSKPEYDEKIIYKEKTALDDNIYNYQRRMTFQTIKEETGRILTLRKQLTKIERKCVDHIEVLNDIYFDLNKFNIRPDAQIQVNKAIHIMNECPNLKFVASSFTDSRGSSEYNRKLSQRRADAVVNYILKNSNLPKRKIMGIGYGESGLKNQCYNGVSCKDREHQVNRRTEIEVSVDR